MTRERPLIVAVDDEPASLALLRKLLTREGYDVVEAVDGESTLRAIAEHQPDLVCLDVMMPAPGGIEVCQRLRRDPEHAGLPILLLTALDRPEDKVRGLEAGANDFLSKPYELSELSARLRSLLRTKALQDRLADLLGRYVSASVATEVLRDPSSVSLGGDCREVSTLFADVRGSTALAAEHPPETILDLLNRFLTVATDAVERHEGTVAGFLGDGIIAVFGAPVIHADDPERAVRSALAMQGEIMRLEIPTLQGVRLQLGIGITTGEVIAGNVGSERRMHYTVIGDPVNVASRLQTAAGPGQILVDEPTHDNVRDLVAVARSRQPAPRGQERLGARLQRAGAAAHRGLAARVNHTLVRSRFERAAQARQSTRSRSRRRSVLTKRSARPSRSCARESLAELPTVSSSHSSIGLPAIQIRLDSGPFAVNGASSISTISRSRDEARCPTAEARAPRPRRPAPVLAGWRHNGRTSVPSGSTSCHTIGSDLISPTPLSARPTGWAGARAYRFV